MPKIKFLDEEFEIPSGTELLEVKRKYPSIPLKFGCTRGECGVCAIHILSGMENLTKMSAQEKETLHTKNLGEGYRLACQCAMNDSIEIGHNKG